MLRTPDAPSSAALPALLVALAVLLPLAAPLRAVDERWLDWLNSKIPALDRERHRLERELAALGLPSIGQTVTEFGYKHPLSSQPHTAPAWLQIDLGPNPKIDTIAVIPALSNWQSHDRAAHGFPRRWRIDLSDDETFTESIAACDFTQEDYPDPGTGPVVIRVPPGSARRYLRLTVTKMAFENGRYFYALAEIMALAGNLNVAIRRPIRESTRSARPRAWLALNVVDGRTPLGPPIRPTYVQRDGFWITPEKGVLPEIVVDLGRVVTLQQIRLHPIHARGWEDTPGTGFPDSFRIDGARSADFTGARLLHKFDAFSRPGNNPVTLHGRNAPVRYVRIVTTAAPGGKNIIGFSEIELYAEGRNLAREATFTATPDYAGRAERWPETLLNDGFVSYGRLLELPEWLREWERRRELTAALAVVAQRHHTATSLARQRAIWLGSSALAFGVLVGVALLIASRHRRQRELAELRARLARDLHDEIGSNLAGLVVLSQVARAEEPAASPQQENWAEVQRIARDSVGAMREVLWLVGGREEAGADLLSHLRLAAARMLAGRDLRWACVIESLPAAWPMDARRHVFLFFKEALANIVRHSQATRVDISVRLEESTFLLEIVDHGIGFDPVHVTQGLGLSSQRERAAALKARFTLDASPGRGTRLRLAVPLPAVAVLPLPLPAKLSAPQS